MSSELETKKEESSVLQYVEAAISSSDRARAVLVVMITAAVLVFTAIWNAGGVWSTSASWMDSRIAIRKTAFDLLKGKIDPNRPGLKEEDKDLYGRAAQFLQVAKYEHGDLDHKGMLDWEIKELLKIRGEQLRLIRVPFFGVVFDANDLGLFAGLTFSVVLLWLRFSLAREHRNLRLAFGQAERQGRAQLQLCYDLLAMRQVLTVPPLPGQRHRGFWTNVARALYLIPALVYSFQYISDWRTREIGYILSRYNMNFLLGSGGLLMALIITLTVLCIRHNVRIDEIWIRVFNLLHPNQGEGGADREEPTRAQPAG